MISANESLSKMTINSYNNPRKSHLLNVVKKIDAELISLIEDRPDSKSTNNVKVSADHTNNRKISGMDPNNHNYTSDNDVKEKNEGGGVSGDFVNIWEEKDFVNQSDSQKTKSLTYVVN